MIKSDQWSSEHEWSPLGMRAHGEASVRVITEDGELLRPLNLDRRGTTSPAESREVV